MVGYPSATKLNPATAMADSTDELDDLLQRAYRYALSLTHDPASADDLVQEACLRLSQQGGPWKPGYLITVVRNRFIDLQRRRDRVGFEDLDAVEPPAAAPCALGVDDELVAALAKLRPFERELLHLAAVENYTASEIAALTGHPRGTVLSALHRAKKKLRALLPHGEKGTLS